MEENRYLPTLAELMGLGGGGVRTETYSTSR